MRVPLGAPRLRLAVEGRPGYKRRWVNDVGGRIEQAVEGGYSLVGRDGTEFKEADAANRNSSIRCCWQDRRQGSRDQSVI